VKKTILIIGSGFAGLRSAKTLSRRLKRFGFSDRYRILLVDKHAYHTYTPTLYEAATTSEEIADNMGLKDIVTFPVIESLKGSGVEFFRERIEKIDLKEKQVYTDAKMIIHYDFLVLALGAEVNYYDIAGLRENSLSLKEFSDALRIRYEIISAITDEKIHDYKIVIGGAGPTGIELALEMKLWLSNLPCLRRSGCAVTVTLIQSSERVLPGFSKRVGKRVLKIIQKKNIHLLTSHAITSVDKEKVYLDDGESVDYDVLIWTGGVKPNSLMSNLPEVNSYMQIYDNTAYGVGDGIRFLDESKKPAPKMARAAIEQGMVAALNIFEAIKVNEGYSLKEKFKAYKPWRYPYIIPVGGKRAYAVFGPIMISGVFGWLVKGLVELEYIISILPVYKAIRVWLKGFWIFMRNNKIKV